MTKLSAKVYRHVQRLYKPLDPELFSHSQFAFSNLKCFDNAVQAVRAGRANKVWMVWAGKRSGLIHFINSNGNIFFDETWVDKEKTPTYYIMREIMPSEYDAIQDVFVDTRYDLINTCGSWLDKLRYHFNPNNTI